MTGGKSSEGQMPADWFKEYEKRVFEGITVYIPSGYDSYLKRIYGDYKTRTLVEDKMADDEHVIINAAVVDPNRPYTFYMNAN